MSGSGSGISTSTKHAILEMVESEKAYVKDLRTIIECFFDPLRAMFKVMKKESQAKSGKQPKIYGTKFALKK